MADFDFNCCESHVDKAAKKSYRVFFRERKIQSTSVGPDAIVLRICAQKLIKGQLHTLSHQVPKGHADGLIDGGVRGKQSRPVQDLSKRAPALQERPDSPLKVCANLCQGWHRDDIWGGTRESPLGYRLPETPASMTLVGFEMKGQDVERLARACAVPKRPARRQFESMQFKGFQIDCHGCRGEACSAHTS